jgi:hypothetical protein
MLSTYVDLALKARAKGITPLELVPPKVNVVWPNFTEIHAMVKKATKPKEVK